MENLKCPNCIEQELVPTDKFRRVAGVIGRVVICEGCDLSFINANDTVEIEEPIIPIYDQTKY